MKNIKYYILLFSFILSLYIYPQQRQNEQLIVTLSKPGQPGDLSIRHINGLIKVTGYEGNKVIIDASVEKRQDNRDKTGLNKLAKKIIRLQAEEKENNVTVSTNNYDDNIDIAIKVPYSFSLNLTSIGSGGIELRNVKGEFVLSCNSGNIHLYNVSGSAVVSSLDGDIIAQFAGVNNILPMKFNILSGKIDLTMPSKLKANVELRSEFGDIYTDFEIAFDKSRTEVTESSKNGLKRFSLEEWIKGTINGGGPRFTIKALNGNIYLRKGK